ncbi:hypothetical protein OAK47_03340 [Planctomycetaceae bacterium]|jgi:hypothetical protein|nr:hypothetical protein [bacterium]MDB4679608.1 hypothetical protein [Planctomycetaceae bacterium]MDC0262238.1 hypothetical protein [Planctomycetaceae bacterium]MDC0274157.1 hypothetical protein [Planctomycetaceae bacterium]MDG2390955.1 hypothetical protein [Planctomycetaceae bacterium]
MKQSNVVWIVVMLLAGAYLSWRAVSYQAGAVYVAPKIVVDADSGKSFTTWSKVPKVESNNLGVEISWPRTLGIWLSALFTLAIFSFLFGDNVFYKVAESIFVGSSAAYAMVVGFWSAFMGIFVAQLAPQFAQKTFMPGDDRTEPEWLMLIPLAMGIMFLWRLMPTGGWISRWPLAFFIAVFAGLRLVSHFEADFVVQIKSTILPLIVFAEDGSFDLRTSLWNSIMVLGTLCCLTYFFFSVEHTGVVGKISRVGIYLLMITFGVGFALTVMSRYSLLIGRMNFLLKDWLNLGASL